MATTTSPALAPPYAGQRLVRRAGYLIGRPVGLASAGMLLLGARRAERGVAVA